MKKPFRVGKKQNRAVLDALGNEVVLFPVGMEKEAQEYCEFINGITVRQAIKQKLEEVREILELPDHVLEGSPVISWSSAVKRAKEEIDKTIKEL